MRFVSLKFVYLFLSLMLISVQSKAQDQSFDESVLSASAKQAYQALMNVELFALGGIGEAGVTSEGEKVLDILVKEKEAIPALKNLVKNAKPEGALYALFGLRMLKCKCFNQEIENFKKNPELLIRNPENQFLEIEAGSVARMSGCKMFNQKGLEVAEEIATGKFDDWIKLKEELKEQKKSKT